MRHAPPSPAPPLPLHRCRSGPPNQQPSTAPVNSSPQQPQQQQQQQPQQAAAPGLDALPPLLSDVRVVLVAPKTPLNVGAAARACANFEALDLWVVAPRCDPLAGEAWKIACGDAVLSRARVVDSLQEALADCTSSVGFTRRAGCTRLTHVSINAMLRDYPDSIPGMRRRGQQQHGDEEEGAAGAAGDGDGDGGVWGEVAAQGTTALVFGREESGLTEDELRLCTHACAIPTGRVQPSMNLSHAVGVVLACLFERRLAALGLEELAVGQEVAGNPRVQAGLQPAAAAELETLLGKVATVARAVGIRWGLGQWAVVVVCLVVLSCVVAEAVCSPPCHSQTACPLQ